MSHNEVNHMDTQHETPIDSGEHNEKFELLILSEAGKPIYSYTKREDAVTLVPLCSALMEYAQKTQHETLRSVKTSDNLNITFMSRSPLIFIVIHQVDSYLDPVILVDQVEAQVISILTAKYLKKVFVERPTFDLKKLIYGSEKLIDAITNLSAFVMKLEWPWVQSFLAVTSTSQSSNVGTTMSQPLPSRPHRVLVPIVSMLSSARESIQSILSNVVSSNSKNIVFSLLFRVYKIEERDDETQSQPGTSDEAVSEDNDKSMRFKLMAVCNHHDKHKIKIADIHIVLALVTGSRFQLGSAESLWLPVCLPRFNSDAFLHSYISCLNNTENCIVMMSIDRDEFTTCQKMRNIVEEKLDVFLKDSNHQKSKVFDQISPLVHPVLLDLQDKLMSNTLSEEELAEVQQQAKIYNSKLELFHARQLQFLWYQTNRQVLWWQRSANKQLSPTLFYVTKKMLNSSLKILWLKLADDTVFLGWHVATFQLYAQFDSTITATEATEVVQRITTWIRKEEDNFSIKDYK